MLTGGGSLTATGVSVTTHGNPDPSDGFLAFGAYNGNFGPSAPAGGTISLTNTTIVTTGASAIGVFTSSGGSTALANNSVTTSGQDAHALVVTGSGSQASLGGSNTFATQGAGAIGFYATAGGGVTASGPATITTIGGVSPSTGLGAFGVNADGAGSNIALAAATITTSGAGATGLFASDASSSGAAGSITVSGTLNIQTKNAAATAVALQGNGASILATGGGTIASAGDAIDFLGGKNQTATFDNFTIANTTGNLIFADPSVATVNFNSTTANAGLNNLLDATNGSAITLNANASALTGAIQTDSTSTTAVNLTSGSVWTMTGSSAVSNLAVTNSAIVFAPPGSGVSFKTLTVGNYVGAGANLTMNTVLGGTGSASDQLVINGGSATGSNSLTIHNVGGAGAQTTGNGIPVVVVSNGGTTASNAFALGNTPVAGGYRYSLEDTNNDWYLVSSPTSTQADIANSVTNVAKAQQQQIVTNRVLDFDPDRRDRAGELLQLQFGLRVDRLLCARRAWAAQSERRIDRDRRLFLWRIFRGRRHRQQRALHRRFAHLRFRQLGPQSSVCRGRRRRDPLRGRSILAQHATGIGTGTGYGKAIDRNLGIFGRVGWVDRLTPIDEAAVYGDISRSWMIAGGYTEAAGPSNPYPAAVQTGLDTLNVARVGGEIHASLQRQYRGERQRGGRLRVRCGSGNQFSVVDFGAIAPYPIANSYWLEYGGRVGYRLPNKMVLDAFLLGTAFGEIGKTLHGGVALRLFSKLQPRNAAGAPRAGEDSNGPRTHSDRASRQEHAPLLILSGVGRRGRDADHLRAWLAGALDLLARTSCRSSPAWAFARSRPTCAATAAPASMPRHEDYALEQIVGDMIELLDCARRPRRRSGSDTTGAPGGLVDRAAPSRSLPRRRQPLRALHPRRLRRRTILPLADREVYPEDKFPAAQWDYQIFYEENFERAAPASRTTCAATVKALFRAGDRRRQGPAAITTAFVRARGGWFGPGHPAPDLPRDERVITEEDEHRYAAALERNGFFRSRQLVHERRAQHRLRRTRQAELAPRHAGAVPARRLRLCLRDDRLAPRRADARQLRRTSPRRSSPPATGWPRRSPPSSTPRSPNGSRKSCPGFGSPPDATKEPRRGKSWRSAGALFLVERDHRRPGLGKFVPAEFLKTLLIVIVKPTNVGRREMGRIACHLFRGGEPARPVRFQNVLVQRAEMLELLAPGISLSARKGVNGDRPGLVLQPDMVDFKPGEFRRFIARRRARNDVDAELFGRALEPGSDVDLVAERRIIEALNGPHLPTLHSPVLRPMPNFTACTGRPAFSARSFHSALRLTSVSRIWSAERTA